MAAGLRGRAARSDLTSARKEKFGRLGEVRRAAEKGERCDLEECRLPSSRGWLNTAGPTTALPGECMEKDGRHDVELTQNEGGSPV